MKKTEQTATKIMAVIGMAVMLFLVFYSWRYTKRLFPSEFFQNEKDSILRNALNCAMILVSVGALSRLFSKIPQKAIHVAAIVCAAAVALFGLRIVRDATAYCVADQYHSFLAAQSFFTGDTEWMQDYEYYKMYPFQLGLSTIYAILFRIAGKADITIIQNVQAICAGAILYAGYRIVRQLFHSRTAEVIYLVMEILFVPVYCYALFIYGETIGTCSAVYAVWFYLEANRTERKKYSRGIFWGLTIIMLAVMYVARSGLLVIWIAMLIMQILIAMKKREWKGLAAIIIALISMLLVSHLISYSAEKQVGTNYDSGCPYLLWVAMGMQEDNPDRGPGAYNDYNAAVYREAEGDSGIATEIAKEYLSARWKEWMQNPGQMVRFFKEKALFQWNEPTYGGFMMTCYLTEPEPWIEDCYSGENYERLLDFLNRYQAMVYLALLGYFIMIFAGKLEGEQMLPGIILLGGFFFTMIWESKSRYVYPYMILILPCVAYSAAYYAGLLRDELTKKVLKRKSNE